jgi:hypothetical protein
VGPCLYTSTVTNEGVLPLRLCFRFSRFCGDEMRFARFGIIAGSAEGLCSPPHRIFLALCADYEIITYRHAFSFIKIINYITVLNYLINIIILGTLVPGTLLLYKI